MSTIAELLPSYEDYMRNERRLAQGTIDAYLGDLRQLDRLLRGADVADTGVDHLRAIMRRLSQDGMKVSTIQRKFRGYSSFWRWLVLEKLVNENPVERVKLPRSEKKIAHWLTEPELERLINTPVERRLRRLEERDALAFKVLAWLGLRRSELLNLSVADVRFADGVVIVRNTKTRRDRLLPIPLPIRSELKAFIGDRITGYVFTSWTGKKWGLKDFNRAFRQHVIRCGLDPDLVHPHTLRHTFATQLRMRGVDIQVVSELLGHADIKSTMVYSHVGPSSLRLALNLHPLSK